MSRLAPAACLLIVSIGAAGLASAQGAPSLDISPDVRAEGAGRALAFLETGSDAAWGNVAGVAFTSHLTASNARTHLVPDLAQGVILDFASISYGWKAGNRHVGVNANYTNLSYGQSAGSGDFGRERTVGIAAGVELQPGLALGVGIKRLKVEYPDFTGGQTRSDAVLPIIDLGLRGNFRIPSSHVDATLLTGAAVRNLGGDVIESQFGPRSAPLPRSLGLAAGLQLLSGSASGLGYGPPFGDVPVVSFTPAVAFDKDLFHSGSGTPYSPVSFWDRNRIRLYYGAELKFLDFLSLRYGRIFDDPGEIKGKTWGYGLSLLSFGGIDYASIPQYRELSRISKWSFWLRVPIR